jgi:uncharacterized protein
MMKIVVQSDSQVGLRMRVKAAFVFILFSMLCENVQSLEFSKQKIQVGDRVIWVEIAESEAQRSQGLMFRKELKKDSGMLFIFEEEKPLSFWMKNTLIPLSIGFFNAQKVLVHVTEMTPPSSVEIDLRSYPSQYPAMYALEMNAGWFEKNKIKPGTKINLKP